VNVTAYVTPTNSAFANTANEGGRVTTDNNGNAYGLFRIPADANLRFRTGDRVFRLTDNPTNSTALGSLVTAAQTVYNAQGLNTVQEGTVLSTRRLDIVTESLVQNRQVTDNNSFWTSFWTWGGGDPIAQSFVINMPQRFGIDTSGTFMSKMDIFFATKDDTLPVIIDIREMEKATGSVTNRSVPFSRVVVFPSQVNTSDDGSKPTPIVFPSPVYLLNGMSYAVVIRPGGDNPNYRVFTARLGDTDLLTGNRISKQPAIGILFASSNDQTYSEIQEEDLKFRLYVARFDKSVLGSAILRNENRDYTIITEQTAALRTIGETIHGETLLTGTFANTKALSVANGSTYVQGA
jgi:hypothetical protein